MKRSKSVIRDGSAHPYIHFERNTTKLSQTLAKKTIAVSASLALAFGGALAFAGSASAAGTAVALTFGSGDTAGTNAAVAAFEGGTSSIDAAPAAVGGIGGDGQAFKFVKTGAPWSGANIMLPAVVDTVLGNKITVDYYNGGTCLLYTSPSPRDRQKSRMPSSA